jgi:hypothetical protein
VKRDANQAAHGLAKEATVTSMERNWIEEILNCIYDIVNLELLALSTYSGFSTIDFLFSF